MDGAGQVVGAVAKTMNEQASTEEGRRRLSEGGVDGTAYREELLDFTQKVSGGSTDPLATKQKSGVVEAIASFVAKQEENARRAAEAEAGGA